MSTKRSLADGSLNSGLTPVKLMWSEITIGEPGGMSSLRLPAALVCSSVSQPSAAIARMAPFISSARPRS